MLLINVVMIKLAERDLIRTRLRAGRLIVLAVEQIIGQHLSALKNPRFGRRSLFVSGLLRLLERRGLLHM
jgi:hypothetical protein